MKLRLVGPGISGFLGRCRPQQESHFGLDGGRGQPPAFEQFSLFWIRRRRHGIEQQLFWRNAERPRQAQQYVQRRDRLVLALFQLGNGLLPHSGAGTEFGLGETRDPAQILESRP